MPALIVLSCQPHGNLLHPWGLFYCPRIARENSWKYTLRRDRDEREERGSRCLRPAVTSSQPSLWENFLVKNWSSPRWGLTKSIPFPEPLATWESGWHSGSQSGFIWELPTQKVKNTLIRPHVTGKYRRGELGEHKWLTIKWPFKEQLL